MGRTTSDMGLILFRIIPVVLGFGLVVVGVAMLSVPASLIVAGTLLLASALTDLGEPPDEPS